MGNSQAKQVKITIPHQRFNDCSLKSERQIIQSYIPVNFSKGDFDYWKTKLVQLKGDRNSNFLFLPIKFDEQMPQIACNHRPILRLQFENFPYLLEQEIKNRSINYQKNYFEESQLWMLLYSLVKSQRAFANLSLKVGDIHPHNIFINQQGYPRLACQFSWPNQQTNFQKMFYDKEFRYLSPEEMKSCQIGQKIDICYSATSQAFSIGLTILSVGLLQNLERICDMKTYKFNENFLDFAINCWKDLKFKDPNTDQAITYSQELKDIVVNLCRINPQERYLPSKIYEVLNSHQQKIMALQPFELIQKKNDNKGKFTDIVIPSNKKQDGFSYHKDLFQKYATGSNQKIEPRNQLNANTLEQIKKNLKLQFTESVHKQKTQQNGVSNITSSIPVYNYGNYTSLISQSNKQIKQNSNPQNAQYYKFSQAYYYPPKVVRAQKDEEIRADLLRGQKGFSYQQTKYEEVRQPYFYKNKVNSQTVGNPYNPINIQKRNQFNKIQITKLEQQIAQSQKLFPQQGKVSKFEGKEETFMTGSSHSNKLLSSLNRYNINNLIGQNNKKELYC